MGFLAQHPGECFPTSTNAVRRELSSCHAIQTNEADDSENIGNDFLKALCIVPPTKDWDRLQRARHYAGDPAFHAWPPAVRLFHPFTATALEVAHVVEELNIEPFEMTFDTWVIVPYMEALQREWMNADAAPSVVDGIDTVDPVEAEQYQKVEELILSEERKGKEKHKARRKAAGSWTDHMENMEPFVDKNSPAERLKQQQRRYEECGGPCVLCLEPNPESKQQLIEMRQELADILDHRPYSSPSSLYSWRSIEDMDMGYRPLIPISSFGSLQSALDVARRLKGLWGEPLTIRAKEFHLISCQDDMLRDEWETSLVQPAATFNKEPWMCNAKVMLIGEEMRLDDSDDGEMIKKLVEEGQPGGLDITNDFTILDDEDEENGDIESWLNVDDDWDEGSRVVIGRTHFFTGEQRIYPGMPASSVIDGRDRSMGAGAGPVSGLARRRRSPFRQGAGGQWKEGEYGHRDSDYVPWSKKERRKKGGTSMT
ncbi:MAG: hypothetical protein SGBAC_009381 [Bacillariaceae sp.]